MIVLFGVGMAVVAVVAFNKSRPGVGMLAAAAVLALSAIWYLMLSGTR